MPYCDCSDCASYDQTLQCFILEPYAFFSGNFFTTCSMAYPYPAAPQPTC